MRAPQLATSFSALIGIEYGAFRQRAEARRVVLIAAEFTDFDAFAATVDANLEMLIQRPNRLGRSRRR